MHIDIPDIGFKKISAILSAAGEESRLVGGCVRDTLICADPKDMDMATTALPDVVQRLCEQAGLRVVPTGLQHGTVTVVDDGEPYEVTTLRHDVETDGRHARVEFVRDWKIDAARRDFTINAMSIDAKGLLHDYFGGYDDLMAGRVRFVGDATARIQEDYLRILRYFRFRARFGAGVDASTFAAIERNAEGLRRISVERVWSEMKKIIVHPEGYGQLLLMCELGVAECIGFTEDERYLSGLRKIVPHADGRPGVALGALISSESSIRHMSEKWKLSTEELEDALATRRTIDDFEDFSSDYWVTKMVNGEDAERIAPALRATGRGWIADIIEAGPPEFPVMGRDLIALGLKPGPQLGLLLGDLKQRWIGSGFTLGKEDLLEGFADDLGTGARP
jgi:poly(A) polymerase